MLRQCVPGGVPADNKTQVSQKISLGYMIEFLTLFSEDYWARVWVTQEITVAPIVTVLYGGLHFAWKDVAAFYETLKGMMTYIRATRA